MPERQYDIVVFGATGFTGQYVVEYVARAAADAATNAGAAEPLRWAVAARNAEKLSRVLEAASINTGFNLRDTDCIICDVSDDLSLENMASKTRLVLNCVGPYRFSGEQVVQVCLRTLTHHLDISGEPQFLERMQLKYHKEAEEKGVYIIGACGFDSIPSDVGRQLVHSRMEGPVNSVQMFVEFENGPTASGPSINFGTYQSAIHGVANGGELAKLRRQLYPEKLPKITPKVPRPKGLHYSDHVKSWCLIFPGSDHSVMNRSEKSRYYEDNLRPSQIQAFVQMPNLFVSLVAIVGFLIFGIMCNFRFGRYLLESFPWLFSMGNVTKAGPSKETIEQSAFKMTLLGKGWKNKAESDLTIDEAPNREVKVVVKGKNVGYGATCEMMVQAGLVTLTETEKLPSSGGVWTPGYAFANTSIVERLNNRQVPFQATVTDI